MPDLARSGLNEVIEDAPLQQKGVARDSRGRRMLRSNVSPDALRSFGEDLKNIADELEAAAAPDETKH